MLKKSFLIKDILDEERDQSPDQCFTCFALSSDHYFSYKRSSESTVIPASSVGSTPAIWAAAAAAAAACIHPANGQHSSSGPTATQWSTAIEKSISSSLTKDHGLYGLYCAAVAATSAHHMLDSSPIELEPHEEVYCGDTGLRMRPCSAEAVDSRSRKVRRNRTVFTELQLMGLERRFDSQKYLSTPDRADLARVLGLTQLQVKTWYQNRRMKWKKQVMLQNPNCPIPPTKPKGRPKKNSIPSLGALFPSADTNPTLLSIGHTGGAAHLCSHGKATSLHALLATQPQPQHPHAPY